MPSFLLLLVWLTASAASSSKCPNNDLSWFRQNARTLLFLEHLQVILLFIYFNRFYLYIYVFSSHQSRAAQENLFDWSNQLGTDTFRSKLRSLEDEFLAPEEVSEECYDRMPIPPVIAQRISFLEDRLESCTSPEGD